MERKKEGLDSVTPIKETFNKVSGKEETLPTKKNYSAMEMSMLIERYARFAKFNAHRDEMLSIRDAYFTRTMEQNYIRGMQLKTFDEGLQSGLHTYKDRLKLEGQFKREDGQNRSKAVLEAKSYYHQNYSLSKSFKESLERQIRKTKTFEKSKDREKTD